MDRTGANGRMRTNRQGLSPRVGTLLLVVAVVAVGVVGYIVLDAMATANTHTVKLNSCAPADQPECQDHAAPSDAARAVVAAGPAG
jgi:hypothetical protein